MKLQVDSIMNHMRQIKVVVYTDALMHIQSYGPRSEGYV